MEYKYIVADSDLRIETPGAFALSDIRQEILENSPDRIVRKSTYPNGFEIIFEQQAGVMVLHCNQPLRSNEDGSFTAPTDA